MRHVLHPARQSRSSRIRGLHAVEAAIIANPIGAIDGRFRDWRHPDWAPSNPFEPSNLRTLEPSHLRTFAPSNLRTLEPSNLRTLEPSNLRTLEPSNLRTLEPSNLRTLEPSLRRDQPSHRYAGAASRAPAYCLRPHSIICFVRSIG